MVIQVTRVFVQLHRTFEEKCSLLAYLQFHLDDCLCVCDAKLIQTSRGQSVNMPDRKLMDKCPKCHKKNFFRACYCNWCGKGLDNNRAPTDAQGRPKLYANIAFPIRSWLRERLDRCASAAYGDCRERGWESGVFVFSKEDIVGATEGWCCEEFKPAEVST